MAILEDLHGRRFSYLRLSVTDTCNFKCQYCLPHGNQKSGAEKGYLTPSEIENLAHGFAAVGFKKIRLTGGEPTTRTDLCEIADRISKVDGIEHIALTTNGHNLARMAFEYRLAGIHSVNVSIDSLNREHFHRLTGTDRLQEVLAGVEKAQAAGFQSVKVNAVYLKENHDEDFSLFLDFVRKNAVTVRFIELMQTGTNLEYFKKNFISGEVLKEKLVALGWIARERGLSDGPAIEYSHKDFVGKIGVIAPYSNEFCKSCNRLRVTSQGGFRLCLFGDEDHDLRPYLQSATQKNELISFLQKTVLKKPVSHFLQEGNHGKTRNFAEIGG